MGHLVIEVPQNINRTYRVDDLEFGEQLLQDLEDFEKKTENREKSGDTSAAPS